MEPYVILPLAEHTELRPKTEEFLDRRICTAFFLYSNLLKTGPTEGDAPFSADFYVILSENNVIGVFSVTKSGSINAEVVCASPLLAKISRAILTKTSHKKIKAILGEWNVSQCIYDEIMRRKIWANAGTCYTEVLLECNIPKDFKAHKEGETRLIKQEDLAEWTVLRDTFNDDVKTPRMSRDALHSMFNEGVHEKEGWCHTVPDKTSTDGKSIMISTAHLIASVPRKIGVIGNVFTLENYRSKGFAQAVLLKLREDCTAIHNIPKLVLFTEEGSKPHRMYKHIGFSDIGHYAMFFVE